MIAFVPHLNIRKTFTFEQRDKRFAFKKTGGKRYLKLGFY